MRELTVATDSPAKTALVYLWAPFANLLWYVETVVMGTISLLVWPFDYSGEMQHACARWWCRMVAVTIGARIQAHGVEQVQAGRSYVYVANHSSLIDTPALFAYLSYQFKIMAKRSLFYVPFMGWHLWSSGNFPIDRGDARKTAKSLKSVIDGVRDGKSLMVFPEGTRTPDGSLQEFKHGAFKIAVRARVPRALAVSIAPHARQSAARVWLSHARHHRWRRAKPPRGVQVVAREAVFQRATCPSY